MCAFVEGVACAARLWAVLWNKLINLIATAIVCKDCSRACGPLYIQHSSAFPTPSIKAAEAICLVANCHLQNS
jgi:hypothetical protein